MITTIPMPNGSWATCYKTLQAEMTGSMETWMSNNAAREQVVFSFVLMGSALESMALAHRMSSLVSLATVEKLAESSFDALVEFLFSAGLVTRVRPDRINKSLEIGGL